MDDVIHRGAHHVDIIRIEILTIRTFSVTVDLLSHGILPHADTTLSQHLHSVQQFLLRTCLFNAQLCVTVHHQEVQANHHQYQET